MNRRMTNMIIALVVVFGGIIAFNVIKSVMIKRFFAHYEAPAVTVSSATAMQRDWKPHIAAVGNFVAINGVDVNAQVGGNVVGIHFNSGQFIEKDQLLIDIDDSVDLATLKFNQADLALQATNYKRQTDLIKHNATSSSSVDDANARWLEAQANVEKTQALINQKHIRAPFSGTLGIRQINLGQYIQPGKTAIVALQSLDPLFLEFYLPEQQIEHLHMNQAITFSIEQNPDLLFEGKVTAINSRIDTNTHTIQVQATLPNCPVDALNDLDHSTLIKIKKQNNKTIVSCDSALNSANKVVKFNFIPGMFAAIDVEQAVIPKIIVLPTTAISFTLYGNSVFVIEKDKNGKKDSDGNPILTVRRVFVNTGDQQDNYTTITHGIKAGQLVVASGELKLQDGTQVTINNAVTLHDTQNSKQLSQ